MVRLAHAILPLSLLLSLASGCGTANGVDADTRRTDDLSATDALPDGGDSTPPTLQSLQLIPNAMNPLSVTVTFSTDEPARWVLEIEDTISGRLRTVTPDLPLATEHAVPVLGLRPAREHVLRLSAVDAAGNVGEAEPLLFETAPLPDDFPPLTYLGGDPAKMEPGFTLFNILNWSDVLNWGLLLIVDSRGEVVWYHRANQTLVEALRTRDGTILAVIGEYNGIIEVDMLGNLLHAFLPEEMGFDSLHHAVGETPEGNILGLSTELRYVEGYPGGTGDTGFWVVGDVVVEFTREKEVVRQFSLLDVLDPYRYNDGFHLPFWAPLYSDAPSLPKDWSHGNAVRYDGSDDSYVVSLGNTDQVVKLDRSSGLPLWILGEGGDFALTGDGEWFSLPHGVDWDPDAAVVRLYDDGAYKEVPHSRVVEYTLDMAGEKGDWSATQSWVMDGGDEPFRCFASGDVDRLANGNLLVLHGSQVAPEVTSPLNPKNALWVRLEELDPKSPDEPLFALLAGSPDDLSVGRFTSFAAERIPSLYPTSWLDAETAPEPRTGCDAVCAGKQCGFIDGCLCGSCGEDEWCNEFLCEPMDECAAACAEQNRQCGPIDVLCSCGDCGEEEMCDEEGECVDYDLFCAPYCEGKECGVVGAFYLGQYCACGFCPEGEECNNETFTCE
jgi:hypothetical protein